MIEDFRVDEQLVASQKRVLIHPVHVVVHPTLSLSPNNALIFGEE
jgi:hypothetical protein